MKSMGTKNLLTLSLLLLASLILLVTWDSNHGQILVLTNGAIYLIALFAVVNGYLIVRFSKLDGPSKSMIGIKKPPADPSETVLIKAKTWILYIGPNSMQRRLTPRFVTNVFYIYIMAVVGFFTFNNRSLVLIQEFGKGQDHTASDFCSDEQPTADQPEKIGCDFLLNAYRLGYVKELGNCEPENIHEPVESQICWLRQQDEPYLHYQWRKLERFLTSVQASVSKERLEFEQRKLNLQIGAIETLAKPLQQAMNHQPRASHHIFTNLARPDSSIWRIPDWLQPNRCVESYTDMPQTLPASDKPGAILKYTNVQLMFQNKHAVQAGFCRDYTLHWDMSSDICDRLAMAPDSAMTELGIAKKVYGVIARYQTGKTLEALKLAIDPETDVERTAQSIPAASEKLAAWTPREVISFNCFFVGDVAENGKEDLALVEDYHLPVRSVTVAAQSVDNEQERSLHFFKPMAGLLAPGFRYHFLASRESLAHEQDLTFDKQSFPLTQLEAVFNQDVLLDQAKLFTRSDLLEVYPWYKHLYNFVRQFREEYRKEQGRL